jgi:hypothetical protein
MGFEAAGPEIDYGMRWGERGDVRVSFAPHGDCTGGYLCAHDRSADRYLLLAAQTTAARVDAAWRELTACTSSPDGYLAFAVLDGRNGPMPLERSRRLVLHCLDREMAAHVDFTASSTDRPARFDLGYAVIVQRAARVAAEDLHIDAVRAASEDREPVLIRYRLLDDSGWTGRMAGTSLESATSNARQVLDVAERHRLAVQATSVTQGHTTVAAARAPELGFAVHRREAPIVERGIGL